VLCVSRREDANPPFTSTREDRERRAKIDAGWICSARAAKIARVIADRARRFSKKLIDR
jgi:hypothetical protein